MPDRKSPPPFVNSTSFDLIVPVEEKLNNAIDIFFIPGGSQEVLKIELLFYAGRWFEDKTGVSQLTANLITKGTQSKNSFEIAQIFDRFGAHVELQPGFDFTSVSLYTVTKFLKPLLDLLFEVVTEAVFPEKELMLHQAVVIQNIKVNEEKTSYLASKAFRKNLFGPDHPYGKEMDEQDVANILRDDLPEYFKSSFRSLAIFVSGKITPDVKETITSIFSRFNSGRHPETVNRKAAGRRFSERLSKEGSVQSSIRAGRLSLLRSDPDYARAIFVNHILGGYFGSRLMKNIREEKGLTYGIYSSVHPLQHESFLVIGADVDNENVDLTIAEIMKELKIMRTIPIREEELTTAKNHFIGSLQSEISTPFAHAEKIKTMYLSRLPRDFYQKMILTVDSIDAETIMEISEKHFHEDTFSYVSAG